MSVEANQNTGNVTEGKMTKLINCDNNDWSKVPLYQDLNGQNCTVNNTVNIPTTRINVTH